MATCKDCFHFDVCDVLRYGDIANCNSDYCGGFFKPKADVVKVVRCKDCKSFSPNEIKCRRDNLWHDKNDFCSYGELKEREGK